MSQGATHPLKCVMQANEEGFMYPLKHLFTYKMVIIIFTLTKIRTFLIRFWSKRREK